MKTVAVEHYRTWSGDWRVTLDGKKILTRAEARALRDELEKHLDEIAKEDQ